MEGRDARQGRPLPCCLRRARVSDSTHLECIRLVLSRAFVSLSLSLSLSLSQPRRPTLTTIVLCFRCTSSVSLQPASLRLPRGFGHVVPEARAQARNATTSLSAILVVSLSFSLSLSITCSSQPLPHLSLLLSSRIDCWLARPFRYRSLSNTSTHTAMDATPKPKRPRVGMLFFALFALFFALLALFVVLPPSASSTCGPCAPVEPTHGSRSEATGRCTGRGLCDRGCGYGRLCVGGSIGAGALLGRGARGWRRRHTARRRAPAAPGRRAAALRHRLAPHNDQLWLGAGRSFAPVAGWSHVRDRLALVRSQPHTRAR